MYEKLSGCTGTALTEAEEFREIYNLDVIKTSDWIIDVGPEGGDNGGLIVAQGTPEEIIKTKKSYTGKFLKEIYK